MWNSPAIQVLFSVPPASATVILGYPLLSSKDECKNIAANAPPYPDAGFVIIVGTGKKPDLVAKNLLKSKEISDNSFQFPSW